MKLKKKLFSGLLVLGLVAAAFTGCGKKDDAKTYQYKCSSRPLFALSGKSGIHKVPSSMVHIPL